MTDLTHPVFLVGYMGSGKTTLGKRLASETKRTFIDLDESICQKAGMSIPQLFEQFGEDHFRRLEREVLQSTDTTVPSIVATGGGAPCFFDNMEWMNRHGITVYLKLPPRALLARLTQGGQETRPLLKDKSTEELLEFITDKLEEREPWYTQAQYIIDAGGLTAAKLLSYLPLPI